MMSYDVIQINSWACSSQDIFQQSNSSTREVDGHRAVMIVLCVYVILVTVPRLWIAHTARPGRRSNLTEILQVTVDLCPAMNTHFSAWTSQAKTVADIRYPFESGGLSVVLFVLFSQHEMKDLDGNRLLKSDVALCCFAIIKNSKSDFEAHILLHKSCKLKFSKWLPLLTAIMLKKALATRGSLQVRYQALL